MKYYTKNLWVGIPKGMSSAVWHYKNSRKLRSRMAGKDSVTTNETEKQVEIQLVKSPYLGAIVIYRIADYEKGQINNNGSDEMPAIVTRIWGRNATSAINLKCLPDNTGTFWRTSVQHQTFGVDGGNAVMAQGGSWRWPDEELKRGDAPLESVD